MAARVPQLWYCQNCEHVAPSLAAARRHAREAGPVYLPGDRIVTHGLTRTPPTETGAR